MHLSEIIRESKEVVTVVLSWLSGSIAHIINKQRWWERMTFKENISHLFMSGFVGYMMYLGCLWLDISWPALWIIIWLSTYSWIRILDALDLIHPEDIKNFILDIVRYKLWQNKWNKQ